MFLATAAWGQTVPETQRGDAAAGAAIAAGKGKCLTCHRIQDTGSRLGPDLTDIGANRTLEQIQTSLVDPDAESSRKIARIASSRATARASPAGCSTTTPFRS